MIPCEKRLLLQEGSHLAGFFGDAASACLYSLQLSGACHDDNALVKDRGLEKMALNNGAALSHQDRENLAL